LKINRVCQPIIIGKKNNTFTQCKNQKLYAILLIELSLLIDSKIAVTFLYYDF